MNSEQLKTKLQEVNDKLIEVEQPRENRIYLCCDAQNSCEVNRFLIEDVKARFIIATGIDSEDCFEVIYHYSFDELGWVINIKAFINDRENPQIESITPFLPAAEWVEREIYELLGIDFKNHPRLERLILADDWPEGVYPLRKDINK